MEHSQQKWQCTICKREFIVDMFSIGNQHQFIKGVTCLECAQKVGGKIMESKREHIKLKKERMSKCPSCKKNTYVVSVFGSICGNCFYEN